MAFTHKQSGAYYTPDALARSLVKWATHAKNDRLLDPSCGDGAFLVHHPHSVGIERDPFAASIAIERAPSSLVHEGDFFTWAAATTERFECAAGNPPFIRYQTFKGSTRDRAISYCARLGAHFSGLSSSWAPFVVATASLLKPGGRIAFVVPAEIGHAPYAAPLLRYLVASFANVHVIAVRDKIFENLSEDCWLLYAEGFGKSTQTIGLSKFDKFRHSTRAPRPQYEISVREWQDDWKCRLRPFILPRLVTDLYQRKAQSASSKRFGDIANIGIGYVSGANDFFHLRPSVASKFGIPGTLLQAAVRNGRSLPEKMLTDDTVAEWRRADDPILLLRLSKATELPDAVRGYLNSDAGKEARTAYKCRVRDPWYAVPDVRIPDYFLSYMSGLTASLVRNDAKITCTNSVHAVRSINDLGLEAFVKHWDCDFLRLSREIEGHPLGGGMLKLEPREASRLLLPAQRRFEPATAVALREAVATMQEWRHYAN